MFSPIVACEFASGRRPFDRPPRYRLSCTTPEPCAGSGLEISPVGSGTPFLGASYDPANRKFWPQSDILPMSEMNSKPFQTKQNADRSGATVYPRRICKKELAKELSVSPRTIDNWVHHRRIPVHRFSPRLLRYDVRKVRNALDKYEVIEAGRKLS